MDISHYISALVQSCGVLSATSLGADRAVDALCFYLAAGTCVALPLALASLAFAHHDISPRRVSRKWRNDVPQIQK
jgi:hypothetical protein